MSYKLANINTKFTNAYFQNANGNILKWLSSSAHCSYNAFAQTKPVGNRNSTGQMKNFMKMQFYGFAP